MKSQRPKTLVELLERGGSHYRVEGGTMINAILHGVSLFPDLGSAEPSTVLETLELREKMQCTKVAHPPNLCPACDHPQAHFETLAENW